MMRLLRWLQRIGTDIAAGKNIEVYVTALLAIILAVIGIIDNVVSIEVQIAALLAGMAILVLRSIEARDKQIDLDGVLRDRQSFTALRDFIRGGKEMWVYGPSAITIMNSAAELELEILQRGGKLRVLVQDPQEEASVKVLHAQLDNRRSHLLLTDIEQSVRVLESIRRDHANVEYGFLPYTPGFSMIIIDPNGRNGRAVIEFFGFSNSLITERMHILIRREQSNYWFEYWAKQYEHMWNAARKAEGVKS
jgi:hypothetical protein